MQHEKKSAAEVHELECACGISYRFGFDGNLYNEYKYHYCTCAASGDPHIVVRAECTHQATRRIGCAADDAHELELACTTASDPTAICTAIASTIA